VQVTAVSRQRDEEVELPTFVELYEEHFAFVWRSIRRLGVDDASVDDAVQDVFVVVHRRLGDFEGRSSVRSWLFGIARRIAKDHRRRRQRKDAGKVPAEGLVHPGNSPRDDAERAEARALLHRFLDGLDDEKREVFVLAELEQLSAPEIAEATETNLNTVYSRLRAARQLFEKAVHRGQATSGGGHD